MTSIYRYILGILIGALLTSIVAVRQLNIEANITDALLIQTAYAYFYYGCVLGSQLNGPTIDCRDLTRESLK